MDERRYDVRPLEESTWPAFAALVLEGEDCVGWCQFGARKHRWVVSRQVDPS